MLAKRLPDLQHRRIERARNRPSRQSDPQEGQRSSATPARGYTSAPARGVFPATAGGDYPAHAMHRNRPAVALLLGLLSGSLPLGASAQGMPTLRDASSVRAAGMGGAARGFASSGEALLINPAGIAAT